MEWLLFFALILLLFTILTCSKDPVTGIQFEDEDDNEGKEDETPPSDGSGQANIVRHLSTPICV